MKNICQPMGQYHLFYTYLIKQNRICKNDVLDSGTTSLELYMKNTVKRKHFIFARCDLCAFELSLSQSACDGQVTLALVKTHKNIFGHLLTVFFAYLCMIFLQMRKHNIFTDAKS